VIIYDYLDERYNSDFSIKFVLFNKKYINTFIVVYLLINMEGYCVKCKSKRDMQSEKKVTMKNGRPATQGICSVCGTKMFKIGK
jgi:Domain of unknown function (DUF5679)